jgi:histidinol-phosphate aminotransferase
MAGTAVQVCPRAEDFTIDVDAALEEIRRLEPGIVFVCTPNNPTGTLTPVDDVARIADVAAGLVVVDEAYYEFSGETIVPRLSQLQNVIVVRTFSKAFRLAGIRMGYAIADPRLLGPMKAVRMPYGQSSFTGLAALIVLRRREEVLEKVPAIVAERERIARELAKIERVRVYASAANFVMFRHPDAERLVATLYERGIVVRDFTHLPGCEGCLRVTVGRPEENHAFLETVADLH